MNAYARVASTAFGRRHPPAGMVAPQSEWLGDVKLFATGWAAGLVFFGTLLA